LLILTVCGYLRRSSSQRTFKPVVVGVFAIRLTIVAWVGNGRPRQFRLMNEFITSILQDRQPMVNVYEALAMTVPGVVAHQSTLKGGGTLKVPQFDPPRA